MTGPTPPEAPKSKTAPTIATVALVSILGFALSRAGKCGDAEPADVVRQQAAIAAIVASASSAAAAARAADGGEPHVAGDGGDAHVGSDARAAFADEVTRAAKATTPALVVHFDDDHFTLEWERGELRGEYHLGRSYEEYRQLPAADRAAYVAKRAVAITGPSLPATFAEAEAKLVPVVRERISYEVARIMASPKPWIALRPEPPHVAVTEELWGVLAFETEDSFVRIESETLAKWNVAFDKVWPDALRRLEERSQNGATFMVGGVRELRFKDGNDSARILLPSLIAKQPLAGGAVVAIPRDDLLLVAGANDEPALRALTERLGAEWERGAQDAHVLRVSEGTIKPFVIDAASPLAAGFVDLQRSAEQRDERLQREALRKRLGDHDDVPFVATAFRARNPETREELSVVVHSEEVTTLLPRADWVVFKRVDVKNNTATTLACGRWDAVQPLVKGHWKETPLRPARWLATELPSAADLKKLGCENPALQDRDGGAPVMP